MSREEIMAYVDGELDEPARARIAEAAHGDPALARQIEAERALRDRLGAALGGALQAPVPPEWEAMIRAASRPEPAAPPSAPVIDLAEARRERETATARLDRPGRPGRPIWRNAWIGGAMAASLVLGLYLGRSGENASPIAAGNGTLVAQGPLAQALDTQLASAQGEAPTRMVATFRDGSGTLCRAFTGSDISGIACRAGSSWQVRHALPGAAPARTEYRQAGSGDGELLALAQDMAAGDPLDAAQEQAARANGWR